MGRGVSCSQCGASTPLPDDLRTPTFECRFCGATLSTEAHAGAGAVKVDEFKAYMHAAVHEPGSVSAADAPRLVHGNAGTREAPCVNCGATVWVLLDMSAKTVACAACGRSEPMSRYVSDVERLMIDMKRQVAGNDALKALVASGVTCGRCGANNPITEPVPIQLNCGSCGHVILLSDHVPADAVDRARLKQSVMEMREGLRTRDASQQRVTLIIALVVVAIVGVIVLAVTLSR